MKNKKFYKLLKEIAVLHDRKNQDYGTDTDCLANLKGCQRIGLHPATGVVIRLQDKWARIENFFLKGKLANESVKDSLLDNAVYSLLAIQIIEEHEKQKTKKKTVSKRRRDVGYSS